MTISKLYILELKPEVLGKILNLCTYFLIWRYALTVGLHHTGLRGLGLPSFKTEGSARSQQSRYQWFKEWRSLVMGRKWWQALLLGAGGREITSYRGLVIDVRWAY